MKYLIVLAVVLFAQQPTKPPEGKGVPEGTDPEISQQSNSSQKDDNSSKGVAQAQSADRDTDTSSADENIQIQRRLVLFTGLLVVAGFITAAVIFWQSWETRKSAEAAKIAADAALLNAQAVINSERAWIDGEIIHREQVGIHCYALNISNHGKTPAKLLSYEVRWGNLSEGVPFSSQSLDKSRIEKLNRLIGSNGPYRVGDWFRVDKMFEDLPLVAAMDTKVICATIWYEDVIASQGKRESHKTSFVYYCRPLLDSLERQSTYDDYS